MDYIKSPLNYTGGKYKLLSQILPLFPNHIDTFVEPFCGGLNVSLNVNAQQYILNDNCFQLIDLWDYISKTPINQLLKEIDYYINKYELSMCNEMGYLQLRAERNIQNNNTILLFLLICYGFNHQIRFNNKGSFNIPFGKNRSAYNMVIRENLIKTSTQLKNMKTIFSSVDFRNVILNNIQKNNFVYCDPPYLVTQATYNGIWKEQEERDLLNLLTQLDDNNIKFALSNVLYCGQKTNEILLNWIKKYDVIELDKTYNNCNYQKKETNKKTQEILVKNY